MVEYRNKIATELTVDEEGNRIVNWRVNLGRNGDYTNVAGEVDYVLTDILPQGHTYLGTVETKNVEIVEETIEDGKVIFKVNLLNETSWAGHYIEFQTKEMAPLTADVIENTMLFKVGGIQWKFVAKIITDQDQVIKQVEKDSLFEHFHYSVLINPLGSKLLPEGETLKITDITNADLNIESFKLSEVSLKDYTMDGTLYEHWTRYDAVYTTKLTQEIAQDSALSDRIIYGADVSPESLAYELITEGEHAGKHGFTLELPSSSQAYLLEYTVSINESYGNNNLDNTVYLYGEGDGLDESSKADVSISIKGNASINYRPTLDIYLTKMDRVDQSELLGAEFELALYESVNGVENKLADLVQDETDPLYFTLDNWKDVRESIVDQTYENTYIKVEETKIPLGYQAGLEENGSHVFNVPLLNLSGNDRYGYGIDLFNDPISFTFDFTKVDSTDNQVKLDGAVFDVFFTQDGEELVDMRKALHGTIDGETTISFTYSDLKEYLSETSAVDVWYEEKMAPEGYMLLGEPVKLGTIRVENNEITFDHVAIQREYYDDIVVTNVPEYTIKLEKVDADNQQKLSGAHFEVYYKDGSQKVWISEDGTISEEATSWIVGEDGTITISPTNEMMKAIEGNLLYLQETKAPEGYVLQTGEVAFNWVLVSDGTWVEATLVDGNLVLGNDELIGRELTITVSNKLDTTEEETTTAPEETTAPSETTAPNETTGSSGGGSSSGGSSGGGSVTTQTPDTTFTIGEEAVPLSSVVPEFLQPLVETLEDMGVPLSGMLPKTGYEDSMLLYAIGLVATIGIAVTVQVRSARKKKKQDDKE